jgi:carnitine-CoA ligase
VPETIPGLLAAAADRDPDGIWLRTDEQQLSFAEAAGRIAAVAEQLRASGVGDGDRVLVTARNTAPYLLSMLAVIAAGGIAVPVNPASAPVELAGLAGQVRPRLLVTDPTLAGLVEAAGITVPGASADELAGPAAGSAELQVRARPDDLAVLMPTSGTTGRSKLVMQTHRAYALAGEGFPYWMGLDRDDRLMTSLPLFHLNAIAYSVLGSLACGAGLVLLPRFSASGFLDSARRHGATEFNAIGAMLEILMRRPERPDDADTDLRLCYTGPAPAREWQEAFERRFGLRVVVGYAMSESPYGLIWPHGSRPYGTLGTVRQHPSLGRINEAKVVGEDGREVATGETGELLLRNPVLTPGYWEMPEETARAIEDGWLHTGDLVTPNADGTYTFVARQKEVLRRRGENVSPAEVEAYLREMAEVRDAAVVAYPDPRLAEVPVAFVICEPGHDVPADALLRRMQGRIASFKIPKHVFFVDAYPMTSSGKIRKIELRAEARRRLG